ncbi:leucine--tRNA ligase [Pseudocnuella soli]|uniref:leucine--tRNA ligase n=1 Tax=Pseudocnuella soli TaxID=2502779 RepID=UPI001043B698|nr:class I tRNA ligase family protein [Pseudocnuella soli]
MEYNFRDIEQKWQAQWEASKAYQVPNRSNKPKYYVLDMFPYPSGAGLHVGHPLGYIASDIFARYKRNRGYNVLHPMGYDAFGLPAEQYAIEHGVHPAVSTAKNIDTFRKQLDKIGFSFDWSREVNTSQPGYYKWTQWIFLQLFNSFYNRQTAKTEPIEGLVKIFEAEGNGNHPIPNANFQLASIVNRQSSIGNSFTAEQWKAFDEKTRQTILMEYRVAYCGYGEVNWCEALGTVLANDEVVNGVSERGGYPVEKKRLRQWYLRITEYADRLLQGLQTVDFSDAMKEMQSNWIGKSTGAEIDFAIKGTNQKLRVYTTRPDTIFGVDFMVIAPELDLVHEIKSNGQEGAVDEYIAYVKSRSERERMAEKKITGVATGAYAVNPFDGREIPIWISEYVLAGYGTGAIMAVPCGDERDHKFAQHFGIPITNIIGDAYNGEEANPTKDAILTNSDFLNGTVMRDAIEIVVGKLEAMGIGKRKTNFKMRDAAFSRQRYWGEPFPIKWIDGVAYPLSEAELPLELPHVDSYGPGPEGEGPLANIESWTSQQLETNTMPGYAGSSWYFLRYMDPQNDATFCDKNVSDYWNQVDLYVGGTEHAVGHLLYSRMWTKALYDLGHISFDEPFKKLLNQGMIQGSSRFVYRISGTNIFISKSFQQKLLEGNWEEFEQAREEINSQLGYTAITVDGTISEDLLRKKYTEEELSLVDIHDFFRASKIDALHVDVNIVDGTTLDLEAFRIWKPDFKNAEFILDEDRTRYICGSEVEKMSKSKFNTVNPDHIVKQYGADTFRMYEMFLGPVEMSKPWETKGIEGVHRFLKKLWRLYVDEIKGTIVTNDAPTAAELKVLHRTIKKIEDDIERFSFNTCVSGFMVCVNDLSDLKCHKRAILEPLLVLLTPFAPHISEELWKLLGNEGSVLDAPFPKFEAQHIAESSKEYPISVNGKLRTTLTISLDAAQAEVEGLVLQNEVVQKWLEGKQPKKIIFVKGKMVNLVV